MMLTKYCIALVIVIFSMEGIAEGKISDVSKSDPSYSAVSKSIENGYFTLLDGNKFLPNQTVSRIELALVLERIDELTQQTNLSSSEIQEVKDFSKRFKIYLEGQQNSSSITNSELNLVKNEQKTIHYDMSRLQEELHFMKKSHKEKEIYIWVGLGLGVLSLLK